MTTLSGGREADLGAAVARAADILSQAKNPVIGGLATDMDGAREAMRIAERIGAVVDHWASEGPIRMARLLHETGTMFTTPGEARNRPDITVIVGAEPLARDPGLVAAALADGLPRPGDNPRQVIVLSERRTSISGDIDRSHVSGLNGAPLDFLLPALSAAVHGHKWNTALAGSKLAKSVAVAAERLHLAHFSLFVFAPDTLDIGLMQIVTDMVKHLNHHRRSQTLPVGDRDNAYGVNQLCVWTCGLPLRTRLGGPEPEHDPVSFQGRRLIESGDADASLWIASFPSEGAEIPRRTSIALVPQGVSARADVVIEVATPGRDYDAEIYDARTGGIAHVPASGGGSSRPRVGDVLRQISSRLGERKAAA